MALLHKATVTPSKLELVRDWLPSQPWFAGERGADLELVAAYRFDDPEGEVGVETLLVAAPDGAVLQIPLTYRGAPLDGGDDWLIGTMEHSVLGSRWIYDALGDPVYLATLTHAVHTGGQQAEVFIEIDGELVKREPTAVVRGSGSDAGGSTITVVRYPAPGVASGGDVLTGSWGDLSEPVLLVAVGG
jgi:hypothetical protein